MVELMFAMAIVALLMALALPSYDSHVQKTRRVEGVTELLELATLMERHHANNGTYLTATATDLLGSASGENGYYALAIDPIVDEYYILLATPKGAHAGDGCGILSLDSLGNQSATGGSLSANDCWQE